MGRVIKGIAKIARPVLGAVGRVVNFIPNQLGKIPVVGKFLKAATGFGMMLIPGLGMAGMASKLGVLGKLGSLGSKLTGVLGKVPGASKFVSVASKAKNWGGKVLNAGKGELAKLPKFGKNAVSFTKNHYHKIADSLHTGGQSKVSGKEAAMAAKYMAVQAETERMYALGMAQQMFA